MKVSTYETFLTEDGLTKEQHETNLGKYSQGYMDGDTYHHVELQSVRRERLKANFPFVAIIEGYDIELDKALQWCCDRLGPADGLCWGYSTEFKACDDKTPGHTHNGEWATFGLGKTGYDYFFNEVYFKQEADMESFKQQVPTLGNY